MFDRYGGISTHSLAFKRFKSHHTELNDLYWTFMPTYHNLCYMLEGVDPDALTKDVFCLSGNDSRRPPRTITSWKIKYNHFLNWTRLNAVLSICSYLELYLKSILTISILSDPGVLISSPRSVDGMKLIKSNINITIDETIAGCIKGNWHSRINNIKKIFATIPEELNYDVAKELDQMRIMRNKVGHTFGISIKKVDGIVDTAPIEKIKLSEKRLKKWLNLTITITEALDIHFKTHHVGNFELLYYYHCHVKDSSDLRKFNYHRELLLRRRLIDLFGTNRGITKKFCTDLISYYNST